MTKDYEKHPKKGLPRTTYDKDYFHHTYWTKFANKCTPRWLQMKPPQKRAMVRAFILEKFTLDPSGCYMFPPSGYKHKRRNDACWPNFWLSNREFDDIVTRVMLAYEAHRQD